MEIKTTLERCFVICERINNCRCIEVYSQQAPQRFQPHLVLEYSLALPYEHDCKNPLSKPPKKQAVEDVPTIFKGITMNRKLEWISVKERLPGTEDRVCLVYNKQYQVEVAYWIPYSEYYYFCIGKDAKQTWEPSHWMPLPQPPKE